MPINKSILQTLRKSDLTNFLDRNGVEYKESQCMFLNLQFYKNLEYICIYLGKEFLYYKIKEFLDSKISTAKVRTKHRPNLAPDTSKSHVPEERQVTDQVIN
jgi:hypothetical protein